MSSITDDDINRLALNLKRTVWKYDDGSASRELVTYSHGDHRTGNLDVQKLGPYKVNFSHEHVCDFVEAAGAAGCYRMAFAGTIESDGNGGGLKVDISPPMTNGKRYLCGHKENYCSFMVKKFAEEVEKVIIVHSYENQGEGLVVKVFVTSLGEKGITFNVEECNQYCVTTSDSANGSSTERNIGGGGAGYSTEVWRYSNSGQQYTRGVLNSSGSVQGNNNNHVIINPPRPPQQTVQFLTLPQFITYSIYKGIRKLRG